VIELCREGPNFFARPESPLGGVSQTAGANVFLQVYKKASVTPSGTNLAPHSFSMVSQAARNCRFACPWYSPMSEPTDKYV
jgi:hypothetical protein